MSDYCDGAIIWKTEKPVVKQPLPWGHYMQSHPDLYGADIVELKREIEVLSVMSGNGNDYAKRRLEIVKTVHDELEALSASKRRRSKSDHDVAYPGGLNVNITNPVLPQAPQPQQQSNQQQMSTATAFGIGAGVAALLFLAFSGLAFLAIFGLFAVVLIATILGVAYLLHRRDKREQYTQHVAPQFAVADTLQPADSPATQAIAAETQDIRHIEHKPVREITAQPSVEVTPLVRKTTAVSTIRNTSKAVKVRR